LINTAAARVHRATINEGFFNVYTVVDCRYLEMDVVREREGSLNGSEVGGARCAMACAARSFEVGLHWRRSLEGEVQEVSEGVQFEMV